MAGPLGVDGAPVELTRQPDREPADVDHLFEKTAAELRGAAQNWWSQSKDAIERQIAAMRGDFENWQTEIKQKNAERAAKNAEDAAAAAITLAAYCLDAAEWAVVRAGLARGEADSQR